MKKYLVFAMCCGLLMACDNKAGSETTDEEQPVSHPVVLNGTNFPDENFRAIVCYLFDAEEGDTIQADRFSEVEDLDLHDYWLIDLKGIEYFTALEQLDCSDNLLKEIDVSKNAELKSLDCGYNRLTAIDVTHNPQLVGLGCSCNQLTSVDVTKNPELENLLCNENTLESIDVSNNPKLRELGVNECGLKVLDVSKNLELEKLYCNKNKFRELDLSNNVKLTNLYCNQPFYRHINIKRPAGKPNLGKESSHMWSTKLSHSYWHTPGNMRILSMRDNIELTPRD